MFRYLGFFVAAVEAAKLPYNNPAEGVNYYFKTSASFYDFLLSKRFLNKINQGICGLEPGLIHNETDHCTTLANLGNSFAIPGMPSSKIKVISCKQAGMNQLPASDKCMAQEAIHEYSNTYSDLMFYLTFAFLALTATATFIMLINKYVGFDKCLYPKEEKPAATRSSARKCR